ncbi:hypothetical protein ACFFVB_18375 [Formosa undariae]|uniref:CcmD family protein n=1 Tax=Formosa undariae TaxID=1325436 RepID=A0ABV5F6H9_9FLAO
MDAQTKISIFTTLGSGTIGGLANINLIAGYIWLIAAVLTVAINLIVFEEKIKTRIEKYKNRKK